MVDVVTLGVSPLPSVSCAVVSAGMTSSEWVLKMIRVRVRVSVRVSLCCFKGRGIMVRIEYKWWCCVTMVRFLVRNVLTSYCA